MELLTTKNTKTEKGESLGYWTGIVHLAPASLSGRNICPMSTAGCREACLFTAGRGATGVVRDARFARTRLFHEDRASFLALLALEIESFRRRADRKGLVPVVRLNGTSDLRFERMPLADGRTIFERFPDLIFYDYTKIPNRRELPDNYRLTFSLAETERSWTDHLVAFASGMSVAVVLSGAGTSYRPRPFPDEWNGRTLVDGDVHDLRFLDPPGVYVGLRAKGKAIRDRSGFVYPVGWKGDGCGDSPSSSSLSSSSSRSDLRPLSGKDSSSSSSSRSSGSSRLSSEDSEGSS